MGAKQLDATHINNKLLLKVMKVADIFEVKLSKTSTNPVSLVSVDGKKYDITKDQLVSNFTTLRGKRLSILSMKASQTYLVARLTNTPCFAVKIPKGSDKTIVMPNGHVVKAGKVIVIPSNKLVLDQEYSDVSNGTIMSEKMFRKTCVLVELSPELMERLKAADAFDNAVAKTAEQPNIKPTEPKKTNDSWDSWEDDTKTQPAQTAQPVQPTPAASWDSWEDENKPQPKQPTQKNMVSGDIIKVIKNQMTNETVAYVILAAGKVYTLAPNQVISLADMGAIGNAAAVTNNNGTTYLRGIGCSLDALPVEFTL